MIVIVGGSGVLGRELTRRLVANGASVRVVSRDADRARAAASPSVAGAGADVIEFATADVRDPASLTSGLADADVVVAAVQGFGGREAGGLQAVDVDGNANLIRAAADDGCRPIRARCRCRAPRPDAPLALARAKAAAEQALRETALAWTIVRPSTYMETWVSLVGDPIVGSGRARVFGRGRNPINFVSALDVAAFVERSVVDPGAAGRTIEVRGPADLTFDELAGRFAEALGRPVPIAPRAADDAPDPVDRPSSDPAGHGRPGAGRARHGPDRPAWRRARGIARRARHHHDRRRHRCVPRCSGSPGMAVPAG